MNKIMLDLTDNSASEPSRDILSARNWIKVLSKYREPNLVRSSLELAISVIPFFVLGALAWYSLSINYWLAFAISFINGGFLVRLFIIQHDCGHNSFFGNRSANNWVGRCLGVLTLTPYKVWRRTHAIHHASSGNLGKRGIGDVYTMTVKEYDALSNKKKFQYRVYRNPIFLFVLAPVLLFVFQNRLPFGLAKHLEYWISAMGTNFVIIAIFAVIFWFGGLAAILLVTLPPIIVAATAGMWLFYVQHQFEDTVWHSESEWKLHDAALHGSSHYVLPSVLRWFSGNIGVHHVHHLYSRIPFYRLMEVLRENEELANHNRLGIWQSLKCARLHLWDESSRKLISFAHAKNTLAA